MISPKHGGCIWINQVGQYARKDKIQLREKQKQLL